MQDVADAYIKKFLMWAVALFLMATVITALAASNKLVIFIFSYMLSLVFVGSNFWVLRRIDLNNQRRFFKIFGWTLAVRFISIIAAIFLGLKLLNNHQIFFTISFIFSYICHSAIEIFFINKILETDTGT